MGVCERQGASLVCCSNRAGRTATNAGSFLTRPAGPPVATLQFEVVQIAILLQSAEEDKVRRLVHRVFAPPLTSRSTEPRALPTAHSATMLARLLGTAVAHTDASDEARGAVEGLLLDGAAGLEGEP